MLLRVQDWALHLSQAGHDYLSNLTVLKVVLVREAQQAVVPVDELVELATSYYELDLAKGAEAYPEEEEVPEVVEEKESYLARKLHLLLKDHFHDQTGKDHQVHKILAHRNLDIFF